MILLVDNYDSFVFNLARYFAEFGCETCVVRNDEISVSDVLEMGPDAVVLSPGPCTPNEAGICIELLRALEETTPVLGVCLGHQAIAVAFGGTVTTTPPMHGRTTVIQHNGSRIFHEIPTPFRVARYHSLIVELEDLPTDLAVTASTDDGLIMAIEHSTRPIVGVQFHPESVLTDFGPKLLANFLALTRSPATQTCRGDACRIESAGPWFENTLGNLDDSHWEPDTLKSKLHW